MQREEFHIDTQANNPAGAENDREKLTNSLSRWKIDCALSKICAALLIVIVLGIIFICVALVIAYENEEQLVATIELHTEDLPPEQAIWFEKNLEELRYAFRVTKNNRRAKNVVLFVALEAGDASHAQRAPIWESFPHLALLRAHEGRKVPLDPTAMFCGIDTHPETIGLDSSVQPWEECGTGYEHKMQHAAASIMEWAQAIGRRTALVTNGDIVQPFPAAMYAHVPNGSWSYNSPDPARCESIQTQLIRGATGKQLNVISGSFNCGQPSCKELFQHTWENEKIENGLCAKVSAEIRDQLSPEDDCKYVLGLYDRPTMEKRGSLHDLTIGALHTLQSPEGFLMTVIADPSVKMAADEMDRTVRTTLRILSDSLEDSLVVMVRSGEGDRFATVHATGPMSHLLHRVHNQTYFAHFISYAARIGRFRDSDLANYVLQIF